MRTVTNDEYNTIASDFGEFHEVAELHACGHLIEVERYDEQIIVKTTRGEVANDDCHVIDRIRSLNWLQSEQYSSAQERKIEWSQDYQPIEIIAYDISDTEKAVDYALTKVRELAIERVY